MEGRKGLRCLGQCKGAQGWWPEQSGVAARLGGAAAGAEWGGRRWLGEKKEEGKVGLGMA